jgi:hypothetical protein
MMYSGLKPIQKCKFVLEYVLWLEKQYYDKTKKIVTINYEFKGTPNKRGGTKLRQKV